MEGKSEKYNYIPSEMIATGYGLLWTGIVYAIKSSKHQAYLHPGSKGGPDEKAFVQPGIQAPYQYWVIEKHSYDTMDICLIRNGYHSTSYLHSGGVGGPTDRAFVQKSVPVPYQLWKIWPKSANF
jgi:hypothetical protein